MIGREMKLKARPAMRGDKGSNNNKKIRRKGKCKELDRRKQVSKAKMIKIERKLRYLG